MSSNNFSINGLNWIQNRWRRVNDRWQYPKYELVLNLNNFNPSEDGNDPVQVISVAAWEFVDSLKGDYDVEIKPDHNCAIIYEFDQ